MIATEPYIPPMWSVLPFAALLLAIAVLPLVERAKGFWHGNRNKLIVAVALGAAVLLYYYLVHPGYMVRQGGEAPAVVTGAEAVRAVLNKALLEEYLPFIALLFCLFTISGGIRLEGDFPAHPAGNTAVLAVGAVLASFIGTTGAAMLLIRLLLHANAERKRVAHTVVFFIFIVCNTGGCLLPIGDPPLFLGYLRGVPFLWTLRLAGSWAVCNGLLLAIYYVLDRRAYRREAPADIRRDESAIVPVSLMGKINFLYLLGVVLAVALLVPGKPLAGTAFVVPHYLREAVMGMLAALSLLTTPAGLRKANHFTFAPIAEVAALFLGIFITMQAPIEILQAKGPSLGISRPGEFFWLTGGLSSFLDNAPTYAVFFELANSLTNAPGPGVLQLLDGGFIRADLLVAISLGAVFMGANTYIGNGPNFMVKSIAEDRGIRMPGFFGYMLYSVLILIPVFILMTLVIFVLGWI
jgi:Na+/H+ antiporter NhaD/arsenite permease-like protein